MRGPFSTPITPLPGSFFHADPQLRAVVPSTVSNAVTVAPLGQASVVLAHCDHVERFAYERQGNGLDASPHLLAAAARKLADAILLKSTKSVGIAPAKARG